MNRSERFSSGSVARLVLLCVLGLGIVLFAATAGVAAEASTHSTDGAPDCSEVNYEEDAGVKLVTNLTQLQCLNENLDADYRLENDINASDTENWNDGDGFNPIGTFRGTFDGQNNTIEGLFIARPSENRVGLFGRTNSNALIKNVGVVDADVTGDISPGGLLGRNEGGTVSQSYVTGSVSGESGILGGLVGVNEGGTINQSYVTASVSGSSTIGGLVGRNEDGGTVSESYATGNVSGTSFGVRGLVGDNRGTVSDSFWDTKTTGQSDSEGGTGLTTSQMTGDDAPDTMTAFDFDDVPVWQTVVEGEPLNPTPEFDGYPILTALDAQTQLDAQDSEEENNTEIDECTEIDESGEYELVTNLSTSDICIEITADDVVLNGQDFTISGPDSADSQGIVVGEPMDGPTDMASVSNVTITNLTLTEFDNALIYNNVTDGTVTNLTATDNTAGFFEGGEILRFSLSEEITLTDSTVVDNDANKRPILFTDVENFVVTDNNVSDNQRETEFAGVASGDIRRNTIERNGDGTGILVTESFGTTPSPVATENVNIENNTIADNFEGISIVASDSTVVDNEIRGSGSAGLSLSGQNLTAENNDIADSGFNAISPDGAVVVTAEDASLLNNTIDNSTPHGIQIETTTNLTVEGNEVTDSNEAAVNLEFLSNTEGVAVTNNILEGTYGVNATIGTSFGIDTLTDSAVTNNDITATERDVEVNVGEDGTVENLTVDEDRIGPFTFDVQNASVGSTAPPAGPPEGFNDVEAYFNATDRTGDSVVTVSVDPEDVAAEGADEITFYTYDEQAEEWDAIETDSNAVASATITTFSEFGAFVEDDDPAPDCGEVGFNENPDGELAVTNASQLQCIGDTDDSSLDDDYVLTTDIDLEDEDIGDWNDGDGFDPIGDFGDEFNGSFDGSGHTIENLTIDRPDESNVGLFGAVESAGTLENVSLENVDILGEVTIGGLVGETGGEVRNVSVSGTVSGTSGFVGGLTGLIFEGEVENISTSADVAGDSFVGGLAGESQSEVRSVTVSGDVTGDGRVGGLIGNSVDGVSGDEFSNITDAVATGAVNGTSGRVGGLVGIQIGGEITRSTATGTVDGDFDTGGLVGQNTDALITESTATGNVTGNELGTGGLLGWNNGGTVSNTSASGTVDGNEEVGGLVGENDGIVTASYAVGAVDDEESADVSGGLVAENSGDVTDSYWDVETTGQDTSDGSPDENGLPTDEMTGLNATETMDGFVFPNSPGTWHVTEDYPALAWQNTDSFYEVNITATNSPIEEGETLAVTTNVTNWAADGEQTVTLTDTDFSDEEQDSQTIELDSGEDAELTLDWETNVGEAATGDVTVASENDTDTQAVTVEPSETIDDCRVIDEPGEYELVEDIESDVTCIEITSSDVVFDGLGNNVTGIPEVEPGSVGILANGSATTSGEITNVTVENVTVQNWDAGTGVAIGQGVSYENVTDSQIRDSEFIDNQFGVGAFDSSTVTLSQNTVTGSGFDLTETADSRVANNTFTESSIAVLAFNTPSLEIVDNDILDDDSGPIDVIEADDVRIERNTITGGFGGALSVFDSAENAVIRDNVITGVDQGVFIEFADNGTVMNNTVTDIAFGDAVQLFNTDGATVAENTVSENAGIGLNFQETTNSTIAGNQVTDNEVGIRSEGSTGAVIEGNNASVNEFEGIWLLDADNHEIVSNTVSDNEGSHGIFLEESSNNEIRNNTALRNGLVDEFGDGIQVFAESNDNLVIDNEATDNYNNGISVFDFSDTNTLRDNIVIGNTQFEGIVVDSSDSPTVHNNTLVNAAEGGIALDGVADAMVSENTVRDSTRGIVLTDEFSDQATVNATLRNNTVYDNELAELVVEGGSDAVVESLDIGASTAANTTLSFEATETTLAAVSDPEPSPDDQEAIDRYVEATSTNGGELVNFELVYEDNELGDIDPDTLALWKFDEDDDEWITLNDERFADGTNTSVDTDAGVIRANITEFSTFGAFGEEPAVIANITAADTTGTAGVPGTLSVTAEDESGEFVEDEIIEITDDGGLGGITDGDTSETDENGVATFEFTEETAGAYNVTVADEEGTVSDTATVTIEPAEPDSIDVETVTDEAVADGDDTVAFTVTVEDEFENPVGGVTVETTDDGEAIDYDGDDSQETDDDGQVTVTATATTAQEVLFTFEEQSEELSEGANATFVAGAPAGISFDADPADETVTADGEESITYTVTVEDEFENPVEGVAVDADATDGTAIELNDDGETTTETTNATGHVTVEATSTTAQDAVEITFTEQDENNDVSGSATFESGAADEIAANVTVDNAVADGDDEVEFTVTVTDANENPVEGTTVEVVDAEDVDELGGIAPGDEAETGADGDAVFTATATETGEYTVAFSESDAGEDTATATFVVGTPDQIAANVTVDNAVADGEDEAEFTVTITDANDNPIENATVSVTDDAGLDGLADEEQTDADGDAVFTATATDTGEFTVEFSEATAGTDNATATFVAGAPDQIDATVTVDNAVADDDDEVEFTVAIADANDNPVASATVEVVDAEDVDAFGGIAAGDDADTDADGEAVFTATASDPGEYTVAFSESDAGEDNATATFVAGAPDQIAANVTVDNAVADGEDEAEFTVTITDANDNSIENATVSVTDDGGLDGLADEQETDEDGDAVFSATATESGEFTVAFSEPDAGEDTATATFVAGAPDQIDAIVTVDNAVADGEDEVEFTVTVADANENPVDGATVEVVDAEDVDALGGLAPGDDADTDENGEVVFTATATETGEYTVAFSESDAGEDTATATFVASAPDQIAANVTVDNAVADGEDEAEFTVTITDANDNSIENATVSVTDDGGLDGLADEQETDEDGQAVFTATATDAGEFTVAFSEAAAGTDNATATFVAGEPDQIDAEVTVDNAVANGEDTVAFTVTITDATDNAVEDTTVTVVDSQDIDDLGGIAAGDDADTDADGQATFTATATEPGAFTVEFSEETAGTANATATFVALEAGVDALDIAGEGEQAVIADGSDHPVSAAVTNEGDTAGEFEVTLTIEANGVEELTETLNTSVLEPGENETVTFENVTSELEILGMSEFYDVTVAAGGANATGELVVNPDVTGNGEPARDATGDGLLDNVIGDREDGEDVVSIADVQALFQNLDNPTLQEFAPRFNFADANPDRVSVFDVQALFTRLTELED